MFKDKKRLIPTVIYEKCEGLHKKQQTRKLEKFLQGLGELGCRRDYDLALKLLKDLQGLDLKHIEDDGKYTSKDIKEKIHKLYMYFIDLKDVDHVEEYLLHKQGLSRKHVKEYKQDDITKFTKHFEEESPTFTDASKHIYAVDWILKYEIERFMELLGQVDAYETSLQSKDIYRSEDFKTYATRAVCGVYGYAFSYVYSDGEFGHKDREMYRYTEMHDEALKEALIEQHEKLSRHQQ